ncbi:phage tail protein [Methylobacter sp.]|uniref:phage tail protein n=1 Tax=Methylobacter sp. TaxID=2051955 RepID=UPI002FDCB867
MTGQIILLSGTAPNPPSTGKVSIYSKSDKTLYTQDDQGNEQALATNVIGAVSRWPGMTVPNGFAVCNGQLLSVSQYPGLFTVLGNSHGGDGVTTFALPNLRSAGGYQTIIRVCNAAEAVAPVTVIVPCVIHGPMPDGYLVGDVLAFTVQLIEPVAVAGGPPKLSITINTTTYSLTRQAGATATEWHYQHTMTTSDSGTLSAAIDLNGAALTVGSASATLNAAYFSNNKNLSTDPDVLSAAMTPAAETSSISQNHALSAIEATTTPTADTGSVS